MCVYIQLSEARGHRASFKLKRAITYPWLLLWMRLFSRVLTSYITPQSHRVCGHCEGFHHQLLWQVRNSLEKKSNSYSSKAGIRPGSLPAPTLLAAVQPSFWELRLRGWGEGSWCFLASLGMTALVSVLWLSCLWHRLKVPALLCHVGMWPSSLAGCSPRRGELWCY